MFLVESDEPLYPEVVFTTYDLAYKWVQFMEAKGATAEIITVIPERTSPRSPRRARRVSRRTHE